MVSFTTFKNKKHFLDLKKEENCLTEKGLRVYIDTNSDSETRLAVSISKSEANSVKRNNFRRKIKEVVRGIEKEGDYDIYIVGTTKATVHSFSQLNKIIRSHPKLS